MIQYNHHAALVHTLCLAEKETRKRTKFNRKNTASSGKQYYFLEYLIPGIFFERTNQSTKKKQKLGGKTGEATTVVPRIRITSRTLWTTTNKLEAGPAANKRPRQRGTDASFTCVLLRSCRDVRRPRHLPNANTAAIFQPDPDGDRPDGTTKK